MLALLVFFSVSAGAQQAGKVSTRINLNASTAEGPTRTRATFTAQVAGVESSDPDAALPTGSVSFMLGERSIGAAFLNPEGRATYTADALPVGEQKITAVYQGDDGFEAANSAPAVVTSNASGLPAFTLAASATSLKVVAGQTVTTVITANPGKTASINQSPFPALAFHTSQPLASSAPHRSLRARRPLRRQTAPR